MTTSLTFGVLTQKASIHKNSYFLFKPNILMFQEPHKETSSHLASITYV